ncbi:VanZ family protein [Pseudokineococcus lusitanus]|uniref:VanZ like protein n=1 Tax=Pseudokineococcus lusitanus TaxID=763993 RepID=A0A3N1G9Q7_9ACTN|nr:VanZ family protein [Pseudokineococcus lusitanus]ROP26973.1 VanZ like protein [Pseudokineococcus lusitanus]
MTDPTGTAVPPGPSTGGGPAAGTSAPASSGRRRAATSALVAALAATAVLTLSPTGAGWTWAPPVEELRWYAAGLGRPGTLVQLLGNLLLLVPAALAASRLRPGPAHVPALVASAAGVAVAVEVLQLVTAAGRVVSPVDALLNTAGAAAAVVVAAAVTVPSRRRRAPGDGPRGPAPAPVAHGRSPVTSPG